MTPKSRKTGRYVGGYIDRWDVKHAGHVEYEALVDLECEFCNKPILKGGCFVRIQGAGFGNRTLISCFECEGISQDKHKKRGYQHE